mmetsp:Transcript_38059/g.151114  ORF Transcript_38059/g.151114 Transcript_38059/m.151114 type:complete len:150 (-) Transcript_38059:348-797(-)
MTGKAVKTVRKATPLATEIRDWLRRARTGERIVYHQPYDYKYVIPQDLLAKDGHPNTIKTSKYIEEHVKQRSQPLAKYNPLKNPWQLFNTVMLAFVVPYVLWTTFSRGKVRVSPGFSCLISVANEPPVKVDVEAAGHYCTCSSTALLWD